MPAIHVIQPDGDHFKPMVIVSTRRCPRFASALWTLTWATPPFEIHTARYQTLVPI
jgi:hypothetical protein